MANPQRGVEYLDRAVNSVVIRDEQIDWNRWLNPEDKARVIPAEALAEEAKRRILLGPDADVGMTLPWEKTRGKVFIKRGKLMLWAGWSRHGKTQMLKQVMLGGIQQSEKVLVCSMEEEVIEVWSDMAAIGCANLDPSAKDLTQFTEFVKGKLWLYDQQGRVSPKKLIALIRYAAAELKITQCMVDSLMMLAIDRDDYDAQARFVAELKTVAKDTGVTVHLVAHMRKRDGKNGEESPGGIHDVSGGQEIGSMVDSIFIPWRNVSDLTAPSALKVDKQRGRINWMGTFKLNYHTGSRQFVEDVHPMRFWDEPGQNF
jgi:twinkle protein